MAAGLTFLRKLWRVELHYYLVTAVVHLADAFAPWPRPRPSSQFHRVDDLSDSVCELANLHNNL